MGAFGEALAQGPLESAGKLHGVLGGWRALGQAWDHKD